MYISIVLTVSRKEQLPRCIDNLRRVLNPAFEHELIVALDNCNIHEEELKSWRDGRFRNFQIIQSGLLPPPLKDMATRRTRIAELHSMIQAVVGSSHFVFGFEDDTELPNDAIARLHDLYKRLSAAEYDVGLVQGVQVGRWGKPYIGAWDVDNMRAPNRFSSLPYRANGIEAIAGGGFYCFMTPTRYYRAANFQWFEPLGPDFWYGLDLSAKGKNNFVDFSLVCGHRSEEGMLYPNQESPIITMERQGTRFKTSIEESA